MRLNEVKAFYDANAVIGLDLLLDGKRISRELSGMRNQITRAYEKMGHEIDIEKLKAENLNKK